MSFTDEFIGDDYQVAEKYRPLPAPIREHLRALWNRIRMNERERDRLAIEILDGITRETGP
jgi:hypothetical protein